MVQPELGTLHSGLVVLVSPASASFAMSCCRIAGSAHRAPSCPLSKSTEHGRQLLTVLAAFRLHRSSMTSRLEEWRMRRHRSMTSCACTCGIQFLHPTPQPPRCQELGLLAGVSRMCASWMSMWHRWDCQQTCMWRPFWDPCAIKLTDIHLWSCVLCTVEMKGWSGHSAHGHMSTDTMPESSLHARQGALVLLHLTCHTHILSGPGCEQQGITSVVPS